MTAPVPAARDRSGEDDAVWQVELARIEAAPTAGESWLPFTAYEGEYANGQVTHRAAWVGGDQYVTGCGKNLNPPDWNEWGIGGPLEPGEWPDVNCPRCPQGPALMVTYP